MNILEKLLDGVDVEWMTVNEIFNIKNGYTPSKANANFWMNGTIPWFRMEDIRKNGRNLNYAIQNISIEAVKGNKLFPENSIIMATSATIGEHALITVPHLSNQRFTNLSIKPEFKNFIDIEFIYYYCFKLNEWCKNNVTVGNFAGVDMVGFKKFKFPIPCPENPEKSLEIQREIVRILDELTDKNTAIISELSKEIELRKKQYEHYRDKLLNFNEIGGGKWRILNDISIKISSGGTPNTSSKEYYYGTIPWLRTQEVGNGEIWDTEIKITDQGLKNSSAKMIPKNCIILAMYGATVGKVGINKISLCTNQACANIQVNQEIANYKYIYHFLLSKYEYIKSLGTGSQTNINAQIVKNLKIPVPTMEVQEKIVKLLDEYDLANKTIIQELTKEIKLRKTEYEYYRNLLLDFPKHPEVA